MIIGLNKIKHWTVILSLLTLPYAAIAKPVGQAVSIKKNAFVERNGQRRSLEQGESISIGDVISTDAFGEVQLLFQDETRIVVGVRSHLVVESILFDSANTASEFTVSAVEGAFRFLSGNSAKSAYSLRTPNGTMGIRGTEFDFTVVPLN